MNLARLNPLVRGGITIGIGIALGNVIGFCRVAITAYLLGTHAKADELAVAISPVDTLNAMLINTMVFAFVPMLMLRQGGERTALFRAASRIFAYIFGSLVLAMAVGAPWLVRALGPGLNAEQLPVAANVLRIASLSTLAAGSTAICSALLLTERKFWATAFNQAFLNLFTIVGALALWSVAGIYGFAFGYTLGAFAQFGFVYTAARKIAGPPSAALTQTPWRELLAKPGAFLVYAGLIGLNLIVTRAHATEAGPGMAAALDYCIRCVNVVIAYLVSPVSNSLLPEIARLQASNRSRDAIRMIDKTTRLVGAAAVAACAAGIALRTPVIAALFERGNFTKESTALVSGVFLGFAPSLIGWTLFEVMSRSLFALNRPWLPLTAAAIPVLVNIGVSAVLKGQGVSRPETIGLGASCGFLAAFVALFLLVHTGRRRDEGTAVNAETTEMVGAG